MKNNEPTALMDAVVAVSNRLLDSNQFLLNSHGKMIDCNAVLSDSMIEIHESLCAVRDSMACEKDQESFNEVILAMSAAMVLWCEKWEGVTQEIRSDYEKSQALKQQILPTVEGMI